METDSADSHFETIVVVSKAGFSAITAPDTPLTPGTPSTPATLPSPGKVSTPCAFSSCTTLSTLTTSPTLITPTTSQPPSRPTTPSIPATLWTPFASPDVTPPETEAQSCSTRLPQPPLLTLPQHIRECIYLHLTSCPPLATGPLRNFIEVPSPNVLRICKQIRREIKRTYRSVLSKVLRSSDVFIRLNIPSNQESRPIYAGWKISPYYDVNNRGQRHYSLWMNDASLDIRSRHQWWQTATVLCRCKNWKKPLERAQWEETQSEFEKFRDVLRNMRELAEREKMDRTQARLVKLSMKVESGLERAREVQFLEEAWWTVVGRDCGFLL